MAQVQVQPQSPVSVPNGVASNGMNQFMSTSLDLTSRRSLGYGYVNYSNIHDAARALEVLNFTPVNGKPIRIMYSHRDPTIRKSGAGNIYIKNLDKAIDNKALHDTFSTFGNILSCKVVTDSLGQSLGYGFVQFDNEESAKSAIDKLNGMLLNDKQVYVGPFLRKQERESAIDKTKFNNVYVKNLSETTTDEDLKKIFGEYGTITSAVVMRDGDGKSKCFGFVNFENPDDAARSVVALNEKTFDDKEWYVGKAQKKSEREIELKGQLEQTLKEKVDKFEGLNLYVKNLDDSITDDKLKDLFSEFGTVTSCKVMRDPSGVSRGSGFVAFSTAEEASRAAQFSQMRSSAMAPAVGPRMPIYPPGTPGIGQQLFYGQSPPAILPPQPGFGYQQQLVPGMRPNFFVPMVQPGQPAQRPGSRRFGAGPVQPQQPLPLMQQQMLPRGRVYRYPPGRNLPDVGGMPFRDAAFSQPMQAGALATALANATPEQQRTLLGENLYPLVDQLEHDNAAKVTGMLLEMDQTEVLHLLESPEALKAKVAEAMEVLRSVQQQQQVNNPTDHMASLSLND
ncbi:hypothetical protein GH714_001275 [Hevea brasiliensis]|uniref:PABP n=1 Tax=Hevea brasiliensis TaxID=3981 RepID=A0A6A6LDX2_HEVBR|nr:hypothetical protein GH714_001275 [Hevea brasiliensis]